MPIHVFLDTSILSANPRRDTAGYRALGRLGASGELVLHLSEITVREFISQVDAHLEKALSAMRTAASDVRRRGLGADASRLITSFDEAISALASGLRDAPRVSLEQWISSVNGQVHPPRLPHIAAMLDNYFSGGPPFKAKKARDDIPDALIYEALRDVLALSSPLHAVVADKQLRQSAAVLPGVLVHETLDDFIRHQSVQDLVVRSENLENNLQLCRDALVNGRAVLDEAVRTHLVNALADETIESPRIPDDNSTARIQSVGQAQSIVYDPTAVNYYGDGIVVLPFQAEVEVLANYDLYKGDWAGLPDSRSARISISDWSDHYYDAEETFVIEVSGVLTIQFDDALLESVTLDETTLLQGLKSAEFEVEDVACTDVIDPQSEV